MKKFEIIVTTKQGEKKVSVYVIKRMRKCNWRETGGEKTVKNEK